MDSRYFLVLAVIIILGWFAFGIIYNLRRGEAVLRWMQSGLPKVGERTTLRWMGSSVAELKIARAKGSVRQLDTLIVLAPRDVPWLWLISGLQGRRDTLIFRAQLGNPPYLDLELADPASWTGRMAVDKDTQLGWHSQPYQEYQLMAPAGKLTLAIETLKRLSPLAEQLAPHYRLFSLHRASPHLELHLPFPDLHREDAGQFFDALLKLAQAVGERP